MFELETGQIWFYVGFGQRNPFSLFLATTRNSDTRGHWMVGWAGECPLVSLTQHPNAEWHILQIISLIVLLSLSSYMPTIFASTYVTLWLVRLWRLWLMNKILIDLADGHLILHICFKQEKNASNRCEIVAEAPHRTTTRPCSTPGIWLPYSITR